MGCGVWVWLLVRGKQRQCSGKGKPALQAGSVLNGKSGPMAWRPGTPIGLGHSPQPGPPFPAAFHSPRPFAPTPQPHPPGTQSPS